jgi:hypothetical protein
MPVCLLPAHFESALIAMAVLNLLVLLAVAVLPHLAVKGLVEATRSWLQSSTGNTPNQTHEPPHVPEVQLDHQPQLQPQHEGMKQRKRAATDAAGVLDKP